MRCRDGVCGRRLAASSARLARDLGHPVYDCFYLALAIHENYPVVTADTRFYNKVRKHPYLSDRVVHVAEIAGRESAGWHAGQV